ncbi:phage tail protein [Sorangium sp. So ce388]|uniref:phage tail protein n=1 Tax=Sorangium sp. So ce388 TaxID=3133309 RepID=UPI003F5C34EE
MSNTQVDPLHAFRFKLYFSDSSLSGSTGADVDVCEGAFAECTGLEGTMEPKVVKEGGRNYGAAQRAGPVTFATVVLKRGISPRGALFSWFHDVASGAYASRVSVRIELQDIRGTRVMSWMLENAMPIKFKAADLNARASDVGIEELHLAHEGLTFQAA